MLKKECYDDPDKDVHIDDPDEDARRNYHMVDDKINGNFIRNRSNDQRSKFDEIMHQHDGDQGIEDREQEKRPNRWENRKTVKLPNLR
jgi:hypothetical protein